MSTIKTVDDIALLSESVEVECKLARGRDGKGQLPADFWPTYSAFANSHGGMILLGLLEKNDRYEISGIQHPDRLMTELFDLLNNKQKVNCNILNEKSIDKIFIEGKCLLVVNIRAASRKEKPVYINGNPMSGTYHRSHNS